GQNASGIVRLRVKGARGDTIRITPAELLDEAGLPTQRASGGPYYYEYVLKGNGVEEWTPRFTYYGFRYALVEGALPASREPGSPREGRETAASVQGSPELLSLQLLHTRNGAPAAGTFACSSPLFNQIYELINWAIRSNLASVTTDCPHREKLGWLEQTHLVGGSIKYNYDILHLYGKIVDDMMEAQLPNGLVPDIAPEYVPFEGGFRDSPEWGSASVIIPWYLYQWYGDKEVLKKAYGMMQDYLAYLGTRAEGHILSHGLGDWFDLGPKPPGPSQLTPLPLTATAIYYYDSDIMSRIAGILGYVEDAAMYRKLAAGIKTAFNREFFEPSTGVYATGSQTSFAMPLFTGLVEEQHRARVFRNLVDSIQANDKALTAGDIGFRYLVRVLEEGGAAQLLYEMNNR
ncbi:MAG TPA: family 78 glycoside hydrolase catalytic domain, partial [Anseongella sp.]|nr:family 78 glycoside hydrolase catalytic domain [Anseongella sp.]